MSHEIHLLALLGLFQTEMTVSLLFNILQLVKSVPDPDLEINRGGAVFPNFFRHFGPQFGPKIGGWGLGPPGPSPGSATGNPHPFIYLKPEDGTPFGRSFPVKAVVGSTPNPRRKSRKLFVSVRIVPSSKTTIFLCLLMTSRL